MKEQAEEGGEVKWEREGGRKQKELILLQPRREGESFSVSQSAL